MLPEISNGKEVKSGSLNRTDNIVLVTLRRYIGALGIVPSLLLLIFLVVYPVLVLVYGSLTVDPPRAFGISLDALTTIQFQRALTDPAFWDALRNSMVAALGGMIIAVVVGLWLAWLVARTNVMGKKLIELTGIMPLFLPSFIGAIAWSMMGSPRMGVLNVFFRELGLPISINTHSLGGIIFVFALYYIPYVYLFTSSSMRRMDPALEEASLVCGANNFITSFKVTFPLILPSITSAGLLVFILMCEVFAVPAVLGLPGKITFLTTLIFHRGLNSVPVNPNYAAALGILLVGVTAILIYIQRRILGMRSYITVAGKGIRPKEVDLRWARIPAFLSTLVYMLLAVVLPYIILIQSTLRDYMYIPNIRAFFSTAQMSMSNIKFIFNYNLTHQAIYNTALLTLFCAFVGGTFYLILAYQIHKTKLPGRNLVDYVTVLPVAIAGVVMGMGYMWAWINLPIGLYGTPWLLALAFVARFLPQGIRSISSSLLQIHPELEEASRISGVSVTGTVRRILIPLIKPGIASAVLLLMILSVRELSTTIFLNTRGNMVLSLLIFDLWDDGRWGALSFVGLLLSVVLALIVIFGQKVLKADLTSK